MATITHSRIGTSIAPSATGHGLLTRLATYLRDRRARAETMDALSMLDARDLRDLHIHPYDFKSIADGSFRN